MSEQRLDILKISIAAEEHVVDTRQRTRQIAKALGFDNQDQVRLATAASELARNAYQYAGTGVALFSIDLQARPQVFYIEVKDKGSGIAALDQVLGGYYISETGMGVGLMGAKKLTDHFELDSTKSGTRVVIGKDLPVSVVQTAAQISRLGEDLYRFRPEGPIAEVRNQNIELVQTLAELNTRQEELNQLNQELADTNRGVVALYAELDEKASSLQKANEIKTSFLSNMTHEFRTPLTSILSLSRLLLDRIDGELSEEQEKQVRYIRQSAEGLLELVSDLLDLAKVEAGHVALKIDDVEVSNVLGAIRGTFKPILPQDSEVELIVDTEPRVRKMVSDEGKLSQILRNLVSNAIKFTEKGQIFVEARASGNDYILFSVRDTGLGIAAQDKERIFEDFSQIESSLQSKSKGTGLGLPLSRKLARLMGGDLWVESKVGEGSTFFVKLPVVYEGENSGSLIESPASRLATMPVEGATHETPNTKKTPHLYFIDDDEPSRYVLKNLTRKYLDATFTEFENATSALEALRGSLVKKPDLIFLDLSMPGISGFEFLREIKSDDDLSEIPVSVNTAKILTDDEKDFLTQLTVAVLSKERSDESRASGELKQALQRAELI